MAIRWDKKYTKHVQRVVKNFNTRLRYQESYGAQYLPEKASVSYIKDVFNNRRDLNRYLRQLENFNAKTAQVVKVGTENKRMTKWERQNLISDRASARAKIRHAMQKTIKRQGYRFREFERGEGYLTMKSELKRLSRPLETLSRSQLERNEVLTLKYREKAKRDRVFKKNFLNMLLSNTVQANTDPDQTGRIMEKLDQLEPDQLLQAYNDDRNLKYIVEHYHLYTGKEHDATLDETGQMLLENELDIIEATIDALVSRYSAL